MIDSGGNEAVAAIIGFGAVFCQAFAVAVAIVCVTYVVIAIAWEIGSAIGKAINDYRYQSTVNNATASSATTATPSFSINIERSLERSQERTREKIKKSPPSVHYWKAVYVDHGDSRGTYVPTTSLSYLLAIAYVKSGGSVFADSRYSALRLAIAVGQGNPNVTREIHGEAYDYIGYWNHYYAAGHRGGHIFYV